MINKIVLFFLIVLHASFGFSQEIKGVVQDAKTNEPIESASIYFDNTTIGTTTNKKGEFSIEYQDNIKSLLIISFLGYQKTYIKDYSPLKKYKILLKEAINTLDEVLVTSNDGMPRELKLSEFKKHFLGFSSNSKSCKILNEDDIILRYFKDDYQITASSRKPIVIVNKNLQYLISYEINDFKVDYAYINIEDKRFRPISVVYSGTSRYEDLEKSKKKKVIKNRRNTYKGSILHFMRALSKKRLEEEGYHIFRKGFLVKPYDFFAIVSNEKEQKTYVSLKEKVAILFNKKQSPIETKIETFVIDQYGNHSPIEKVIFSGYMGVQGLGGDLPLDYQPE